jgi:hypothetical protein
MFEQLLLRYCPSQMDTISQVETFDQGGQTRTFLAFSDDPALEANLLFPEMVTGLHQVMEAFHVLQPSDSQDEVRSSLAVPWRDKSPHVDAVVNQMDLIRVGRIPLIDQFRLATTRAARDEAGFV